MADTTNIRYYVIHPTQPLPGYVIVLLLLLLLSLLLLLPNPCLGLPFDRSTGQLEPLAVLGSHQGVVGASRVRLDTN